MQSRDNIYHLGRILFRKIEENTERKKSDIMFTILIYAKGILFWVKCCFNLPCIEKYELCYCIFYVSNELCYCIFYVSNVSISVKNTVCCDSSKL